ncbi:MAG TPA: hypothetical protein VMS54_13295 [Vicinamibacterales bacterium]|nr:hypothetical protein [Vicinamibacterales bacterium]
MDDVELEHRAALAVSLSTPLLGRWLGQSWARAEQSSDNAVQAELLAAVLALREPDAGDPTPALAVARRVVAPEIRRWTFTLMPPSESRQLTNFERNLLP